MLCKVVHENACALYVSKMQGLFLKHAVNKKSTKTLLAPSYSLRLAKSCFSEQLFKRAEVFTLTLFGILFTFEVVLFKAKLTICLPTARTLLSA